MWRLLIALALALAPAEPTGDVPIQRPGEAGLWAFEWQAPAGCPSREQVLAGIRAYLPALDEPPGSPGRAELRILARVSEDAHGWTARLRLSGRGGVDERAFSAPACAELADATALIAAVALDPVLVTRRLHEPGGASASVEPEPSEPKSRSVAPERDPDASGEGDEHRVDEAGEGPAALASEPRPGVDLVLADDSDPGARRRSFEIGLGVHGVGGWGPVDAGFGGLAGGFALSGERWRWQLEGGWWTPRTLSLADGRSGRIHGWWLGTRGCVVPELGPVELPLCPGVEAGQVRARGIAPTNRVRGAEQAWVALVVGQGLRWAFTEQLALTAEAALLIPLVRGRFLIGEQPLASLVPVGVRGALGLELRF